MTGKLCLGLATTVLLSLGSFASAQTITVTIASGDVDVDWQTATVSDLPGPDGEISFSEALIASNNTPGPQTIGFAIPESEWILQFLLPGRAVLTAITGFFFHADEEVIIDGTTQTAFTGDTNPDGAEVAIYGAGLELYLNGDNCTLIGFDSSSITLSGSNGLIEGNTGSMNITLGGGSGNLIENNTGGTIMISGSTDNTVVGNTFQRIRVIGGTDNVIGGPDPADRNYFTGFGSWNSEGIPSGMAVQLSGTAGTVIENNWIGTTPDGLVQGNPACTIGIRFQGENNNAAIRNNRIAGILGQGMFSWAGFVFGWAVSIGGTGDGIELVGNTIGLDANDEPLLGSVVGVDIGDAFFAEVTGIQIGGAAPGEGNTIAGHIFNGVTVARDLAQVRLSGNSIYDNGWLGIDLIPDSLGYGVTPNDPLDADTGGNGLQNFPEILSASTDSSSLHAVGLLESSPAGEFTLEFFASPDCDDSGFGEGELYVGSTTVYTDASGDADFDIVLPASVPGGWNVTATATLEPIGATSEFSACVEAVALSTPFVRGDANTDGIVDISDPVFTLAELFSGGPTSSCSDATDANDDGSLNVADAVATLAELFGSGPVIPAPYPSCGLDPTADGLSCVSDSSCP